MKIGYIRISPEYSLEICERLLLENGADIIIKEGSGENFNREILPYELSQNDTLMVTQLN